MCDIRERLLGPAGLSACLCGLVAAAWAGRRLTCLQGTRSFFVLVLPSSLSPQSMHARIRPQDETITDVDGMEEPVELGAELLKEVRVWN